MTLNKLESAKTFTTDERDSFSPDPRQTETSEVQIEFNKWHGQYREVPELQGVIDKLALWVVYGGDDLNESTNEEITFENEAHKKRFEKFTGYGKDTPEEILYNLFRVGKICGTTTAEIIKTRKSGVTNLKPLDPQTIKVRINKNGFIHDFEQVSVKSGYEGKQQKPQPLKPEKVFYIAWNRIADEVIGIPTGEKLEKIIDWRHQAMEDLAETFHRYVKPFWVFYVDTDDPDEIEEFNTKVKKIFNQKGKDHLTIPEETVKKHERMAVPQFASLDPLNWIKHLERYFLISEGVPELISGIGRETADAASRMIYLAWRVVAIANQKMYEKQIERQLGIKLKFPRPLNIMSPGISENRSTVNSPESNENSNKQKPNSENGNGTNKGN